LPSLKKSDSMKLEHVALSVMDQEEVEYFYQAVLGMKMIRKFQLNLTMASDIFGIAEGPEVYLMQKDQLQLELFIARQKQEQSFAHVCISLPRREETVKKAEAGGYTCYRLEREHSDLIFIFDRSGNSFEIKEA